MLRLTVEHITPRGREVLDVVDISNRSDLAPVSDYGVEWTDEKKTVKFSTVRRHVREHGRWRLIARIAQDIADKTMGTVK